MIIVECKTAGAEFNKEKKKTEEDGGQLFSYWQQEGATRWLTLYSSDFKDNEICYKCLSVNCSDDANIAKIAEKIMICISTLMPTTIKIVLRYGVILMDSSGLTM